MKVKSLSHARLLATPWTAAYQAPPSMGFYRQEYWSGVPLPSPRSIQKKISGIFSLGSNYVLSVKYVKLDILNLLPGHKTNLTVGT